MTLKKPGCYAVLVFENCRSKERSSDLGSIRSLAILRFGSGEKCLPISLPGFTELLVVWITGSVEDQSRAESHDRTQAPSLSLSAPDKRKATHSPPWLFRGVRVQRASTLTHVRTLSSYGTLSFSKASLLMPFVEELSFSVLSCSPSRATSPFGARRSRD